MGKKNSWILGTAATNYNTYPTFNELATANSHPYCIIRMEAYPGDNFLTVESIITGGAFIGGVVI